MIQIMTINWSYVIKSNSSNKVPPVIMPLANSSAFAVLAMDLRNF